MIVTLLCVSLAGRPGRSPHFTSRVPAIRCPCGHDYEVAGTDPVTIVRCSECGTGATLPAPQRDVHGDGLFDDTDAGYGGDRLAMRDQWFREAQVRLDWMNLRPGAELLEIGAATGEFVALAERAGHPITGLETSPRAVAEAASVTACVRNSDLANWLAGGRQVDAVAMFHVLEHLPDPAAFLTEIRTALHPGGALYLEVPHGGSYLAQRDGVGWWAARTEDHFFHFSSDGLRSLLLRAGFDPALRVVHRDVYVDRRTRRRGLVKDSIRPLLGKGRRSYDLLRAVARKPDDG